MDVIRWTHMRPLLDNLHLNATIEGILQKGAHQDFKSYDETGRTGKREQTNQREKQKKNVIWR